MLIDENHVLIDVSSADLREGKLIIPHGVKIIKKGAVKDLPQLTEVIISDTVERLETHCITNTGIIHLVIPETVRCIEILAFENNQWLTILEIANPNTGFNGSIIQNCRSLTTVRVGAVRYNVRCLKYGVAYTILAKKMVDIYTVYSVEPFKESTSLNKMYVAIKQGVIGDGTTIERAMEDCHNRYLTPNILEAYKNLTLDTPINSFDYKRITGACDEGIIKWMKENGYQENDAVPARELIKKLGTAFGAKIFSQFIADRYKDRSEARNGKKQI